MNNQIVCSLGFTTVHVDDFNNANLEMIDVLIGQVLLDADLDEVSSMDLHKDLLGLGVIAEYNYLNSDTCRRVKFQHIMACAMKAFCRQRYLLNNENY